MELLVLVLLPFAAAIAAPWLHRRLPDATAYILALVPLGVAAWFLNALPHVSHGGVVVASVAWLPQLGIYLALRLDGLGLLFALLITVIGALVTIYAGRYLHGTASRTSAGSSCTSTSSWAPCWAWCWPMTCWPCSSSGS